MKTILSIIIVEHNDFSFLKRCLRSIDKTVGKTGIEICVVCNVPSKKTRSFLCTHYPKIMVVENEKKKGFAENCSIGARWARGKYLLFLNPDTVLLPNALQNVVRCMDAYPTVGICGPQLLNPNGTLQYSCRRFPTWKSFLVRRTPLRMVMRDSQENSFHLMKDIDHTKKQEVDWVLGGCMCVRKKMVEDIGGMDKGFFLYVEDIDFCLRAWRHGWKVMYCPHAKVVHTHKAQSDALPWSTYSFHHLLSMIRFVFKHGVSPKRA